MICKKPPLRGSVKAEYGYLDGVREAFTPKHDGCVPDSMLGDDVMTAIIDLFKAVGYGLLGVLGLDDCCVWVEPCYEDATHFLVVQGFGLGGSGEWILLHDYIKAWHLNFKTEDEFEEWLAGLRNIVQGNLRSKKLFDFFLSTLKTTRVKRISSANLP